MYRSEIRSNNPWNVGPQPQRSFNAQLPRNQFQQPSFEIQRPGSNGNPRFIPRQQRNAGIDLPRVPFQGNSFHFNDFMLMRMNSGPASAASNNTNFPSNFNPPIQHQQNMLHLHQQNQQQQIRRMSSQPMINQSQASQLAQQAQAQFFNIWNNSGANALRNLSPLSHEFNKSSSSLSMGNNSNVQNSIPNEDSNKTSIAETSCSFLSQSKTPKNVIPGLEVQETYVEDQKSEQSDDDVVWLEEKTVNPKLPVPSVISKCNETQKDSVEKHCKVEENEQKETSFVSTKYAISAATTSIKNDSGQNFDTTSENNPEKDNNLQLKKYCSESPSHVEKTNRKEIEILPRILQNNVSKNRGNFKANEPNGREILDQKISQNSIQYDEKALRAFDRLFGEWEKKYEAWKTSNLHHNDRQQYLKFLNQWDQWKKQLASEREVLFEKIREVREECTKKSPRLKKKPQQLRKRDRASTEIFYNDAFEEEKYPEENDCFVMGEKPVLGNQQPSFSKPRPDKLPALMSIDPGESSHFGNHTGMDNSHEWNSKRQASNSSAESFRSADRLHQYPQTQSFGSLRAIPPRNVLSKSNTPHSTNPTASRFTSNSNRPEQPGVPRDFCQFREDDFMSGNVGFEQKMESGRASNQFGVSKSFSGITNPGLPPSRFGNDSYLNQSNCFWNNQRVKPTDSSQKQIKGVNNTSFDADEQYAVDTLADRGKPFFQLIEDKKREERLKQKEKAEKLLIFASEKDKMELPFKAENLKESKGFLEDDDDGDDAEVIDYGHSYAPPGAETIVGEDSSKNIEVEEYDYGHEFPKDSTKEVYGNYSCSDDWGPSEEHYDYLGYEEEYFQNEDPSSNCSNPLFAYGSSRKQPTRRFHHIPPNDGSYAKNPAFRPVRIAPALSYDINRPRRIAPPQPQSPELINISPDSSPSMSELSQSKRSEDFHSESARRERARDSGSRRSPRRHEHSFSSCSTKRPFSSSRSKSPSIERRNVHGSFRERSACNSSPPRHQTISIESIIDNPGRNQRPGQIVIFLRGLPGSGKTHVAKLIKDQETSMGGSAPRILSLDDYFMVEVEKKVKDSVTGQISKKISMDYEYEADLEPRYRNDLAKAFKKTVDSGFFPFIIVDCINDKVKHFDELATYATQRRFQVYVAELESNTEECFKRNIHGRSKDEIFKLGKYWDRTPPQYIRLDLKNLLDKQKQMSTTELEDMEVVSDSENNTEAVVKTRAIFQSEKEEKIDFPDHDEDGLFPKSKWETLEPSEEKLNRLDGLGRKRPSSEHEDNLTGVSIDTWLKQNMPEDYMNRKIAAPGEKRVRWADIEERRAQAKMRDMGFVVGQDWSRMTDPTFGSSALTKTRYF